MFDYINYEIQIKNLNYYNKAVIFLLYYELIVIMNYLSFVK